MSAPRTAWAPYKCPFQTCTWKLLLPVPTWVKQEFARCTAQVTWRFPKSCWSTCSTVGPSVPSLWILLISQDPESQARSSLVCRRWQSSGLHTNKELVSRKKGKQENWSWQLAVPQHFGGTYWACLAKEGFEGGWKSFYLVNFLHRLSKTVTEHGPEQCVVAYCASCTCPEPFPIMSSVFPPCCITWWVQS